MNQKQIYQFQAVGIWTANIILLAFFIIGKLIG